MRAVWWMAACVACTSAGSSDAGLTPNTDPSEASTDTDLVRDTDPPRDTAFPTPFERDLAPLLFACTGCHAGENAESGLDLTDIRATLGAPSGHLDMALIEPGNHLQSYLWHKVAGTQSVAGGLGQQMPPGGGWTDADIALLARWIDLGAPE